MVNLEVAGILGDTKWSTKNINSSSREAIHEDNDALTISSSSFSNSRADAGGAIGVRYLWSRSQPAMSPTITPKKLDTPSSPLWICILEGLFIGL
jgi:hypothetical protein